MQVFELTSAKMALTKSMSRLSVFRQPASMPSGEMKMALPPVASKILLPADLNSELY